MPTLRARLPLAGGAGQLATPSLPRVPRPQEHHADRQHGAQRLPLRAGPRRRNQQHQPRRSVRPVRNRSVRARRRQRPVPQVRVRGDHRPPARRKSLRAVHVRRAAGAPPCLVNF